MAFTRRPAGLAIASLHAAGWLTLFCLGAVLPGSACQAALGRSNEVVITVKDENHVAVASAQVTRVPSTGGPPVHGQTDFDGRATFPNLSSGVYKASLNLFLERRFRIWGYEWAHRDGYDDITGRRNPFAVYNNIDSPLFFTLTGIQGRAFTGRIRFLGRK